MAFVSNPFAFFTDADGNPVENGSIYVGYPDARANPLQLYWDSGLTQTAAQPIPTIEGYPVRNGSPAQLYIEEPVSVMTLLDGNGVPVFTNQPHPFNIEGPLASPQGAGLVGFSHAETYPDATVGAKLTSMVSVLDAPFNAAGDGTTNDAAAFNAAVAALPATGGTIIVPDAVGYKLDTAIATGTKPVRWVIGHTTITCPPGDFAFKLQSNGSGLVGSGRDATLFKLRTPVTAVTYPSVAVTRSAGAITAAVPSGSSGIVSCPVVQIAKSPANDVVANDAGAVAYFSGGAVTSLLIGAQGADYVSDPAVTFIGGGAGAVLIDNVQYCKVSGFSIDFQNVPGSTGLVHRGGWYAEISNITAFYNKTTGVSSEHGTSIMVVVDSYTLGSPGPTGGFGGVYICNYRNISGSKRAIIGHDTSTATTLHWDTCDFKNSFIHASVAVKDTNVIHQGNIADAGATEYFYDLLNVDSLYTDMGDLEQDRTWYHFMGSCSNITVEPLAVSATGNRYRGIPGTGTLINPRKLNASGEFPLMVGSLSAGRDMINTGFVARHRFGIAYDGGKYVVGASNFRPTSDIAGIVDDIALPGIYTYTTTGAVFGGRTATAGVNPRSTSNLFEFNSAGLQLFGVKVLGAQGAAIADVTTGGGATAAANATAINSILARMRAHGLIAT